MPQSDERPLRELQKKSQSAYSAPPSPFIPSPDFTPTPAARLAPPRSTLPSHSQLILEETTPRSKKFGTAALGDEAVKYGEGAPVTLDMVNGLTLNGLSYMLATDQDHTLWVRQGPTTEALDTVDTKVDEALDNLLQEHMKAKTQVVTKEKLEDIFPKVLEVDDQLVFSVRKFFAKVRITDFSLDREVPLDLTPIAPLKEELHRRARVNAKKYIKAFANDNNIGKEDYKAKPFPSELTSIGIKKPNFDTILPDPLSKSVTWSELSTHLDGFNIKYLAPVTVTRLLHAARAPPRDARVPLPSPQLTPCPDRLAHSPIPSL